MLTKLDDGLQHTASSLPDLFVFTNCCIYPSVRIMRCKPTYFETCTYIQHDQATNQQHFCFYPQNMTFFQTAVNT